MQQQEKIAPNLRFPEFRDKWEESKLGKEITKVGSGVTPRGGSKVYKQDGIPLLRSQNVRGNRLDLTDVAYIDEDVHDSMSSSKVRPNDVLLNITGASIGRSCVVPDHLIDANVNQHVCIIRLKASTEPRFLQTLLASHKGQKLIFQSQAGGGREGLNFENIKAFKIKFPKIEEQQKIAAFLGAVDEKIAQLQKKKDLLEDYKKGCIQKLFSQELRFTHDNGNSFPDWEEIEMGKFGSVRTSSVDKLSKDGEKPAKLLNYMDVYRRDHIIPNDKFQDITAPDGQFTASNLKEGDILFTPSSETPTDIGHSAVVTEDLPSVLFSYHLMRFRPNKGVLLPSFSGYAFKSHAFYVELWKRAQGATRYTISKAAVEESKVRYPKSLDEQQKIADFLSVIDDKIALVAEELDKAKTFKKGLLQQMFV